MISRDGKFEIEMLDDQGIAWVHAQGGPGGPLQLLDMLGPRRYIGVQLITLTPELRRHFGVPEDRGVMVSKVLEDTPAAKAGIEVGDVLVTADGSAIDTAGDVTRVLVDKQSGEEVQIDLWRGGERMDLAVAFEERQAAVLDLGQQQVSPRAVLLHERGDAPVDAQGLANKTIAFRAVRQEELDDALRGLDEYFQSQEWQERLRQLKNLDLDEVQQRMKTLERRLQELERELAAKRR
jgi:membrane-associated protease RseP (regulator of RpoE activity)